MAAFTTSKGNERYGFTKPGCNCPTAPCFRIDPGQEWFPFTTWIQFDNVEWVTSATLTKWTELGTGGFLEPLKTIRTVMGCAIKSRDGLNGRDKTIIAESSKAMSIAAQKAKLPKGPLDDLRAQVENHEDACRRQFYELLELKESYVAEICATPGTVPKDFIDKATLALGLVVEECKCHASKKPSV